MNERTGLTAVRPAIDVAYGRCDPGQAQRRDDAHGG